VKMIQMRLKTKQRGLSLLLVIVLLVISISTSLFFHERMISSTRISGATRDNSESMMLAESAMEMLRGGFINTLDSRDCVWNLAHDMATGNDAADCLADTKSDAGRAATIGGQMSDTVALEASLAAAKVKYLYYVGAADQQLPNILQRVANGGAGVQGAACTIANASHSVSAANCNMDINTLFNDAALSPLLFTTNANGLLINSDAASWQAELASNGNNRTVAAAWIELTVNVDNPDAIDMWVQAAASVGVATSYVQRYVGTYHPASNVLGSLAGLVESSNIDREP